MMGGAVRLSTKSVLSHFPIYGVNMELSLCVDKHLTHSPHHWQNTLSHLRENTTEECDIVSLYASHLFLRTVFSTNVTFCNILHIARVLIILSSFIHNRRRISTFISTLTHIARIIQTHVYAAFIQSRYILVLLYNFVESFMRTNS